MLRQTRKSLILLFTTCFCLSGLAIADSSMEAALNADIRSADEKARDASRKPAETLAFFDVKADSKVLELMPGGGWYTKILANYLKDKGELYVAIGANPERMKLVENKLDQVKIIGKNIKLNSPETSKFYDASDDQFEETGFDVALTFRNMHNLSVAGRTAINKAVFNALKPGGIYGVIDHTRKHMEADSDELWRRVDPVQMILELESVGFEFDDYSALHSRPDDKLIYDSTHESINRDSDRFTLKFRKPS